MSKLKRNTYLDEHIDESSEVLIELISLALRNLEELGDVEEELTLLVVCKLLSLVQQENHLVQKRDALLTLQRFVVEQLALLHQHALLQVRVSIFVFYTEPNNITN